MPQHKPPQQQHKPQPNKSQPNKPQQQQQQHKSPNKKPPQSRCSHGASEIGPVARLSAANIELADIALRRPSLDDVFLSLTGSPVSDRDGEHTSGEVLS
jgi:hypothetical protein